ncbi:MAG: DUF1622 domain-containing protein [Treponema sp.]|nr:DUF1622 domain-containing protein [Treponema sp.]
MKDYFIVIAQHIVVAIGIISMVVICYGIIIAVVSFITGEIAHTKSSNRIERLFIIRSNFGIYLLLGLDFLIAEDVLKTILDPEIEELIVLGGVVLVREILSFFLNRELKSSQR